MKTLSSTTHVELMAAAAPVSADCAERSDVSEPLFDWSSAAAADCDSFRSNDWSRAIRRFGDDDDDDVTVLTFSTGWSSAFMLPNVTFAVITRYKGISFQYYIID